MSAMDRSATTETPDDPEVERAARDLRLRARYRKAARRALAFARRYRAEEGSPGGARERACIAQARAFRRAAWELAAGRPGLARARPEASEKTRQTG